VTEKKLKVQWLVDAIGFGKSRVSLGVCENQPQRIAFMAPNEGMAALLPLIVRDLYLTARDCEEGKRCLLMDCPHNRTTYTSYKNSASWNKEGLPRKKNFDILLGRISEWGTMLKDEIERIDWNNNFLYLYPQPVIVLTRRKKARPLSQK
jgi:hypothetical protein